MFALNSFAGSEDNMDRRHLIITGLLMAAGGQALAQTAAPSTAATMSQAEADHAMKTAMAGAASLMMADIGLEKAQSAKIKEFAKFEHDEQTTIAEILKSMDPSMTPPKPDAATAQTIDKLKGMKAGAEFDRAFVQGQIDGHEKLLAIQEEYLKAGKNREHMNVAKLARGMIKEHLALLGDLKKMA